MTDDDSQAQDRKLHDLAVWGSSLFALAALCVALYWLFWTSVIWFRFHPHLPWRDLFVVLRDIIALKGQALDAAALGSWLAPHYEAHRILLPRLLMSADIHLLGGHNHAFYASGLIAMVIIWLLCWGTARSYLEHKSAVLFYACLTLCWLASPAHSWNMINAINTAWHLTMAFSLLGFFALLRPRDGPALGHWLIALVCTILAAFSTFGGVVAVLLLPVYALFFDRQRFILVIILSGLFTWWYTRGMVSDAHLATEWDVGSPEIIELIREQARAALSNHTIPDMLDRTVRFLSWPAASASDIWPRVISAAAAFTVLMTWLAIIVSTFKRGLHVDRWVVFCLLGASLALGIALATQLGRVLDQPNHAHGPSLERYQTVVVCFWICWLGMIRGLMPPDRIWVDLGFAGVAGALTIYLNSMTGAYLNEEIKSSIAAAELYSQGEYRVNRGLSLPVGSRFEPEYVYQFDSFFQDNQAGYHAGIPNLGSEGTGRDCASLGFRSIDFEVDDKSIDLAIAASAPGIWQLRDLVLFRDGEFIVRLTPRHHGDFTPGSLIDPGRNYWGSPLHNALSVRDNYSLMYTQALGRMDYCQLNLSSVLLR